MEIEFKQETVRAAARPEVIEALHELYADVQVQIDVRRPLCVVSGRCCRFEEFGHRLFVTTLEAAGFLHDVIAKRGTDNAFAALQVWDGTGCPFQIAKLCSVHSFRPFGCRMFFCDATSTTWQNEQYEIFHTRLKQLHQTLDVPYFYMEWRAALRAIAPAGVK